MQITEFIPANKIGAFNDVLVATGGRYLQNPLIMGNKALVKYEPGDQYKHLEMWNYITKPIIEKRSDQWWKILLRRIF